MFSFATPYWCILLLLPVLKLLWDKRNKAQKAALGEAGAEALYHPASWLLTQLQREYGHESSHRQRRGQRVLWWLSWLMLVLAAMGPQWVEREVRIQGEGIDMLLAVDLSRSMLAMDFATDLEIPEGRITRLDVVKAVVQRFISERMQESAGDRYGLILFGEHAYIQSPLTLDGQAVIELLKQSEVGMAGDATAIGDAMALGVRMLRTRPKESRAMILLTDGTNTAGGISPNDAAEIVKAYGVRFYAIAVGNRDMVPFPEQTPFGQRIVMVRMEMDEAALKEIADISGGSFFRADSADTLRAIYDKIDRLERSTAEEQVRVIAEPLYRWPLGGGVICLLLLVLVPVLQARRTASGKRKQAYG